jgi:hypothetical protein
MTFVASVQQIRNRFPALERRHNRHPGAYFAGHGARRRRSR